MPSATIALLRRANHELSQFFRRILPSNSAPPHSSLSPAQLEALANQLTQIGDSLKSRTAGGFDDTDSAAEITEYKVNLEQFQQTLQAAFSALQAQRVRMESDRVHLEAARAWAATLKQTR